MIKSFFGKLCVSTFACLMTSMTLCAAPEHVSNLKSLLKQIDAKNTGYTEKSNVIWKGEEGSDEAVCYTDSSGLVNAVFAKSYNFSGRDFNKIVGSSDPIAADYYHAIKAEKHFERITYIRDLNPGDIIAIIYPKGFDHSHEAGHLAFVNKSPKHFDAEKPFAEDTQQWILPVIDSAKMGHGKEDHRDSGHGAPYSGLGKGMMRLYIDNKGHIVGYAWSESTDEHYYSTDEHPIVVGRLIQ